jgi:hypothetical protein
VTESVAAPAVQTQTTKVAEWPAVTFAELDMFWT